MDSVAEPVEEMLGLPYSSDTPKTEMPVRRNEVWWIKASPLQYLQSLDTVSSPQGCFSSPQLLRRGCVQVSQERIAFLVSSRSIVLINLRTKAVLRIPVSERVAGLALVKDELWVVCHTTIWSVDDSNHWRLVLPYPDPICSFDLQSAEPCVFTINREQELVDCYLGSRVAFQVKHEVTWCSTLRDGVVFLTKKPSLVFHTLPESFLPYHFSFAECPSVSLYKNVNLIVLGFTTRLFFIQFKAAPNYQVTGYSEYLLSGNIVGLQILESKRLYPIPVCIQSHYATALYKISKTVVKPKPIVEEHPRLTQLRQLIEDVPELMDEHKARASKISSPVSMPVTSFKLEDISVIKPLSVEESSSSSELPLIELSHPPVHEYLHRTLRTARTEMLGQVSALLQSQMIQCQELRSEFSVLFHQCANELSAQIRQAHSQFKEALEFSAPPASVLPEAFLSQIVQKTSQEAFDALQKQRPSNILTEDIHPPLLDKFGKFLIQLSKESTLEQAQCSLIQQWLSKLIPLLPLELIKHEVYRRALLVGDKLGPVKAIYRAHLTSRPA